MILRYLKRTVKYSFSYQGENLWFIGCTNADCFGDFNGRKLASSYAFLLNGELFHVWARNKRSSHYPLWKQNLLLLQVPYKKLFGYANFFNILELTQVLKSWWQYIVIIEHLLLTQKISSIMKKPNILTSSIII